MPLLFFFQIIIALHQAKAVIYSLYHYPKPDIKKELKKTEHKKELSGNLGVDCALKFWYLTVNLRKVSVTLHDGKESIV